MCFFNRGFIFLRNPCFRFGEPNLGKVKHKTILVILSICGKNNFNKATLTEQLLLMATYSIADKNVLTFRGWFWMLFLEALVVDV